ncbi:MAG: recombinase family protein, partial [Ruminococcus sp.]|nr:recombinase family protein [Ruminococcus sp.]
ATAMSDIARFSEEMKTLREFIENEKAKQATAQRGSAELDAVLERLEHEDFTMTDYDDVVVRQLIDNVTVESKDTITVTFKGGFAVRKETNGD